MRAVVDIQLIVGKADHVNESALELVSQGYELGDLIWDAGHNKYTQQMVKYAPIEEQLTDTKPTT